MKHGRKQPESFWCSSKNWVVMLAAAVCTAAVLGSALLTESNRLSATLTMENYETPAVPEGLTEPVPEPVREVVDLADYGGMPKQGQRYGSVSVTGTAVSCDLYYGDKPRQLQLGAGTSLLAEIPGQGGVTLVGAHTGSFFRDLESAEIGAQILVTTDYGDFCYEIREMQVVEAEKFTLDELDAQPRESFLMYTCYPFGQTTPTPYRYMLYAEYVSGPEVVNSGEDAG